MTKLKKLLPLLLMLCLLAALPAAAETSGTLIVLNGDEITVDGAPIPTDETAPVFLTHRTETHDDVPEALAGLENRVVTIAAGGVYRLSGAAEDVQIAVRAGDAEDVRLILDGVRITCRTSSAVAVYSARDPRMPGAYGVTIELAGGSDNLVCGSHTVRIDDADVKLDGAVCSLVSLGFEGTGKLTVDADNEGVEVKFGHLTINGGVLYIQSGDDPLNVSEDGVGVLTMNDGYVFSAVKNAPGGEGDGIDSNGCIVFNGGTAINLAHPASQDSGIDSDMGSSINGGLIVGAGNMYDSIEDTSAQLFMMLEFADKTDDLLVVTDETGAPVFAYDFPYDYMYIAFSTPQLQEGATYHVYLGGEIMGEQRDGLYTRIDAYVPGRQMTHGGGVAAQRTVAAAPGMGGMPGMGAPGGQGFGGAAPGMGGMPGMGEMPGGQGFGGADVNAMMAAYAAIDLNVLLADTDLNEVLSGVDLNTLLTGVPLTALLDETQLRAIFGDAYDPQLLSMLGDRGGMGGMSPRTMASSADEATTEFVLRRGSCAFSGVSAVEENR